MYKTVSQAVETAQALLKQVAGVSDPEIMIAPHHVALNPVGEVLKGSQVSLGGQNLFWEKEGAYTGEVSGQMLVSAGCRYAIIGHSERRQYFGETDETVNKRMRAALEAGLIPVLCVGESESQREEGKTENVLDRQVRNGLKDFLSDDLKELVVAYEPVWAIGTGKTATREQAQEAHAFIRELLSRIFSNNLAQSLRILYGGSVKPDNIADLMEMNDVDGALVGGASLKADSFAGIVRYKED
jgi:triosephosphate isomerase